MTLLLLAAWWLFGHSSADLAVPWSGWFVALFICAILDLR